ncbi:alpha/beta hydrolase [Roseovarius aestuariivivens]|uniref:alpha/beta hydrolase n=1 Tax=Roseovarius aestuariivivens TaxID=1888910 RepID=UPI0010800B35|nr:alpha/beta fold hydrolase [Roseovarius aestuariivivens]
MRYAMRWMRRIGLACGLGVLAACGPQMTAQYGPAAPEGRIVSLMVAMQRPLDDTGARFGARRVEALRYLRADISIPPVHRPGRIEWAEGAANPSRHFVVAGTQVFGTEAAFLREVRARRTGRETQVFVHGYNNTLSHAMYRLAQMRADFGMTGAPVLFSWASAGDPRGYVYDRDSVLYARDDLEALLARLTAEEGERVTFLAHSMGAHLVMEVMRQAALRGDRALLDRISGVVLMSPDLDPDLFRRQVETIGDLPQPFLIFVSQQDRALRLSSLITGRKPRLGRIDGPEAVAGLPVKVIDFTALSEGEGMGHAVPATSPAAITVLRGMIDQAARGAEAFADYMVLTANP